MAVGLGFLFVCFWWREKQNTNSLSDNACFETPKWHLSAGAYEHFHYMLFLTLTSTFPRSAPNHRLFCRGGNVLYFVLSNTVATSHIQLVSTWNVASKTKELTFKFYLILINLNVIELLWLVATILDTIALEIFSIQGKIITPARSEMLRGYQYIISGTRNIIHLSKFLISLFSC